VSDRCSRLHLQLLFISRKCFVCQNELGLLEVISDAERKMIFMKRDIFIPAGNRCCKVHLYDDHLSLEALLQVTAVEFDVALLDTNAVTELLNDCHKTIQGMKTFDFDDPTSFSSKSYYNLTGLDRGKRCF
jgi:hypothetical protein